jgi:hypothetical protein
VHIMSHAAVWSCEIVCGNSFFHFASVRPLKLG